MCASQHAIAISLFKIADSLKNWISFIDRVKDTLTDSKTLINVKVHLKREKKRIPEFLQFYFKEADMEQQIFDTGV